ncbi:hypothetical protein ACLOJK_038262 [Asimina triloba]
MHDPSVRLRFVCLHPAGHLPIIPLCINEQTARLIVLLQARPVDSRSIKSFTSAKRQQASALAICIDRPPLVLPSSFAPIPCSVHPSKAADRQFQRH